MIFSSPQIFMLPLNLCLSKTGTDLVAIVTMRYEGVEKMNAGRPELINNGTKSQSERPSGFENEKGKDFLKKQNATDNTGISVLRSSLRYVIMLCFGRWIEGLPSTTGRGLRLCSLIIENSCQAACNRRS